MVRTRRERQRGILLPLVLILVGAAVLAGQVGWLDRFDLWGVLQLWPLALIAVGADLLTARQYTLWIVVGFVAVGAVLIAGPFGGTMLGAVSVRAIERPIGQAITARVQLQTGVAALRVDDRAGADVLISGEVAARPGERIVEDYRPAGSSVSYSLRSEQQGITIPAFSFGERTWDLALTDRIPLDLRIETGVGRADLDLAGLQLSRLAIRTGVGAISLDLPGTGRYDATIDTGVGASTIRIPEGVGARIVTSRGVGAIDVRGNADRTGDTFVTPDWSTADHRVDLRVTSGVGAVSVRIGD